MPIEAPSDSSEAGGFSEDLLRELEQVLTHLRTNIPGIGHSDQQFALIRLLDRISLADWMKLAPDFARKGWLFLPLASQEGSAIKTLHETLEQLFYQRDHDVLTGLSNRRSFDRLLAAEMERAERTRAKVSLVVMDIDHFKVVNDTYGHPTGDKVLAELGGLLTHSVRPYDVAARIGGEEFCLILPGASVWRAHAMARRVLESFRALEFTAPDGCIFKVTLSAGVATAISYLDTLTGEALLAKADGALYEAKRNGRNRVVIAAPGQGMAEHSVLVQADEKKFLYSLAMAAPGKEAI